MKNKTRLKKFNMFLHQKENIYKIQGKKSVSLSGFISNAALYLPQALTQYLAAELSNYLFKNEYMNKLTLVISITVVNDNLGQADILKVPYREYAPDTRHLTKRPLSSLPDG